MDVRRRQTRALAARPSELVHLNRDEIARLAEELGITNVRVFGSASRGTDDATESDLDLLVTLPDRGKFAALMDFKDATERLIAVPVDVVSDGGRDSRTLATALKDAFAL